MRTWIAALLVAVALPAAAEMLGPLARTRQIMEKSHDIVVGPGDHKQKVTTLNTLLRGFLDTDAMGREAMGKHLDGYVGWAHLFTGDFISETGASKDVDFLYAAVSFTF